MQSRRIVDAVLRRVGIEPKPLMETDSVNAVIAHVRAGHWASIMPNSALETVEMTDKLRAIPLMDHVFHTIGLVVSERYPIQPGVASLIDEARARAPGGLLPAAYPPRGSTNHRLPIAIKRLRLPA